MAKQIHQAKQIIQVWGTKHLVCKVGPYDRHKLSYNPYNWPYR